MKYKNSLEKFSLSGQVVVITGGAGLLGNMHAEAILEADGCPVLLDISDEKLLSSKKRLEEKLEKPVFIFYFLIVILLIKKILLIVMKK